MFILCTALAVAIVVVQTTIFRLPSFHGILYDLLIPLVIFARLDLSERKAAVLVVMVGFLMDVFSGGIFGLYLTVYFWIFILVKGISNYFNVKGTVFRSVLIALCILAENLVLLVFGATAPLFASRVGSVIGQMILGAMTGPPILIALKKINARIQAREREPALSRKQEVRIW